MDRGLYQDKRAMVALEHSPEFLALEALLLSIVESFKQLETWSIVDYLSFFSSGRHFVQPRGTVWTILIEGLKFKGIFV